MDAGTLKHLPINDPPATMADLSKALWYSQLDSRNAAVVIEQPTGQFTPYAWHFNGKRTAVRQGCGRKNFRDAAENVLRMAGEQGALVDPLRWPQYFRG